MKDHEASLRRFLAFCGNKRLDTITVATCERYFAERLGKVRPATANKDRRTLQAVFQRGLARGYLRENPWAKVKPVREPEKAIRVLTEDEVGKLLASCPSLTWRAFIFVAVSTGLRCGELCWLEWEDIDLNGGILLVRCKEEHRTKSGRNRAVALVPSVVALLKRLQLVVGGRWVFQTSAGTRFGDNVRREFRTIVHKSGIRHCTIHDLRRTFVSHLAMAGVNQAVVQQLAGHASMQTTLRHYTAILPEVAREAPSRLPWAKGFRIVPNSYRETADGEIG